MKRSPHGIAAMALACLVSFSPPLSPILAQETPEPEAEPKKPSRIEGTVQLSDGGPARGARVLLVSMADREVRIAGETAKDGSYAIEPVAHGYYEIVFETGEGRFIGNRILLVPPGKDTEANFVLDRFRPQDERSGLTPATAVPGLGGEARGVARLEERLGPSGWRWFRTGKGVAVLLGGGTLLVAGLIALADDEVQTVVSPVTP